MKVNVNPNFFYKHSINKVMQPCMHIFDFFNTNNNKIGTLVCHKSERKLRPNYNDSVLAIDFLEVTQKNQGYGTKILEFAKEYSKQIGCNGFLTLKADVSYMHERIPHIFYRKFGFSSFDKSIDKKLDKFIQQKKDATLKDFPCLLMHYPPMADNKAFDLKKILVYLNQLFKKIH